MKRMSKKTSVWLVLALVVTIVLSNNSVLTAKAESVNDNAYDKYHADKYEDMNTLNATVTVKTNILKVKANNAAQTVKPSKVVVNGKALKLNKDYTVSYQVYTSEWEDIANVTKTGLYRICVNGIGKYSGVCTKRIYVYDPVQRIPVSAFKIKVNKMRYTGKPVTSGAVKSVKYKNNELIEGRDYAVTYLDNGNSNTGIVRITGISDVGYVGEKEVKYQITGMVKISSAKVTGITAKTYDGGNEVTQDMSKVKLTYKGETLVQGVDYIVQSYTNNTKVGTAKMVIAGKGKYYGTVTKTFKINKIKLTKDMLDEKTIAVKHTGKAVKPDVMLSNDGTKLVKGVDYTLAYKNNVKMSDKAVITVKGKGNYTGSFKVNFVITDKDIVEQPDEDEKPTDGSGESEKPSEGSDESEKPSEGFGEGEKPSEGDSGDEAGESKPDDNGTGDGDDVKAPKKVLHVNGVEVEVPEKPIAFSICNCNQAMPVFVYGLADEEYEAWYAHSDQHLMNGEPTNYTSMSYEKILKYGDITEDMAFQPLTFFKLK
ncbi:MAG: hypothetical protein K2O32_07840 [Acetatifactor sp.]|nr:hypothetical protein [Acetatifactor sp.]